MTEFFKLNQKKIKIGFNFLAVIGISFTSVLLVIARINNQLPDIILTIKIYVVAGLIFPGFGLLVVYLDWFSRDLLKRKKFKKSPLNELDKIGFSDSLFNESNKWFFAEKIKKGKVNGYTIEANIKREEPKFIQFSPIIHLALKNESDIIRVIENLKLKTLYSENEGVITKMNIDQIKSITEIEMHLKEFTQVLRENNLIPK